jgi:hypothetical protein
MEQAHDLSLEERQALDELRALIGEVVRLDHEYQHSADLTNPDDIGGEREAALLELLRCRFGGYPLLQRATVQDADGRSYKQHDVLFADPWVAPHRILRSGRVLIGSRGVHAVIEVKSTLTSKSLVASLEHLAELKRAPRCDSDRTFRVTIGDRNFPYIPINGGIFAYRSHLRLSVIAQRIQDWAERNPHELWPNFVTVLNRGHMSWVEPLNGAVRNRRTVTM